LFEGARFTLLPALMAFAGLALDFPMAMGAALLIGLFLDAASAPLLGLEQGGVTGFYLIYFGMVTLLLHGCRPWFQQGRWWLHPVASAVIASGMVLLEFLIISYTRRTLYFDSAVVWRIVFPGALNLLLAPLICWLLAMWAGASGVGLRRTSSKRKYNKWR